MATFEEIRKAELLEKKSKSHEERIICWLIIILCLGVFACSVIKYGKGIMDGEESSLLWLPVISIGAFIYYLNEKFRELPRIEKELHELEKKLKKSVEEVKKESEPIEIQLWKENEWIRIGDVGNGWFGYDFYVKPDEKLAKIIEHKVVHWGYHDESENEETEFVTTMDELYKLLNNEEIISDIEKIMTSFSKDVKERERVLDKSKRIDVFVNRPVSEEYVQDRLSSGVKYLSITTCTY